MFINPWSGGATEVHRHREPDRNHQFVTGRTTDHSSDGNNFQSSQELEDISLPKQHLVADKDCCIPTSNLTMGKRLTHLNGMFSDSLPVFLQKSILLLLLTINI